MKIALLFISVLFLALPGFAAPKPPKDVIGMDRAKEIAAQTVSGEIQSSELEHEKGRWVYSFDIRGEDQNIHEVLINAKNGKIASNTVESAAEQAAEKKAESNKK